MSPQTQYIASEARWLLSFGTPPLDVAKAPKRKPESILRMANRHELADIRDAFMPYANGRRNA